VRETSDAGAKHNPSHAAPSVPSLMAAFEGQSRPKVLWHVPGRSQITGTCRGKAEVMKYISARQELAGGTFQITVRMFSPTTNTVWSSHPDRPCAMAAHGSGAGTVCIGSEIKVAECRLLPEDQYLFDEIWS